MRGLTCSTLFGLIAVTGMRINEALSLDADDVDLDTGIVHIRCGKLGKERLLPVHETAVDQLRAYVAQRYRLLGRASVPFFVKCDGSRLGDCGARYNFAHVCQRIGLREPQTKGRHGRGPRIHDLRHSFAARTMIDWYRSGKDPAREMIKLTHGLATPTPITPTGISRPFRNCWIWRQLGSPILMIGRSAHDRHDVPGAAPTLLHRPALHADGGKPPYDRGISRYVPASGSLCCRAIG